MSGINLSQAFGPEHAEVYDKQFERLHAIREVLLLLAQAHFAALPSEARILVAGAGTGAEVRHFAPLFPGWRFALVDPAPAMLAVARRRAEAEGFAARCSFHEGFVSTLEERDFDAATSVMVSHFLTDAAERRAYFTDIATRLVPGGLLFNADLCAEMQDPSFEPLMTLWLRALAFGTGMPEDRQTAYRGMFGQNFAAQGPAQLEALIEAAGFEAPTACGQLALVRAWVTSRRR